MDSQLYFDFAATGIPDADIARRALQESLTYFANPSSPHAFGKTVKERLEYWRERTAQALGVQASQIIFTSGATESNQIILQSMLMHKDSARRHITASGIEHASVHENLLMLKSLGFPVSFAGTEADGRADVQKFIGHITDKTRLVLLIWVNNETGAVQPVSEIIKSIRALPYGGRTHIHIDGVQAAGRLPLNLHNLDCDSACLSAHKMGGPKGIGILYLKKPFSALMRGGGQENEIRAGTENLFGICACALTLEKYLRPNDGREHEKLWIDRLKTLGASLFPAVRESRTENFIPGILSFGFPPLPGEVLMRLLSEQGVYVGTGSACGNLKKDRLRVLTAMGIPDKTAQSAVRVSFGAETSLDDSRRALDILEKIILEQRKILHF